MSVSRFNIRIYGLLVHAGLLLVSDEVMQGFHVTKFPGGGMEPGEGTLECLRREIKEEMGMEALDLHHFYTTDFFQQSAYRPEDQIISIYYTFQVKDAASLRNGDMASGSGADPGQRFRWIALNEAGSKDVHLPIDKVVMELVIRRLWILSRMMIVVAAQNPRQGWPSWRECHNLAAPKEMATCTFLIEGGQFTWMKGNMHQDAIPTAP